MQSQYEIVDKQESISDHQFDNVVKPKSSSDGEGQQLQNVNQQQNKKVNFEEQKQQSNSDDPETSQSTIQLQSESKLQSFNKEAKDVFSQLTEGQSLWICEHCQNPNVITININNIPDSHNMTYMVQPIGEQQRIKGKPVIIFCIDNSGSMSVTEEVEGQIMVKYGPTNQEIQIMKRFSDDNQQQQNLLKKNNGKKTWVSRKQNILKAIENQILLMRKNSPNQPVGIVTFNNEVTVIGDGMNTKDCFVIKEQAINNYDQIVQIAKEKASQVISYPIDTSFQCLLNQFNRVEEQGQTALGPGLLTSVALASQFQPGSQVIICTDGLANTGLGSLEVENQQSLEFYKKVTDFANKSGISISLITIESAEQCKLKILSKIIDETKGSITRVKAQDIDKDFAQILSDKVVATNTCLSIKLPQYLQFRNEYIGKISQNGSQYTQEIGNATSNSNITFEYELRDKEAYNLIMKLKRQEAIKLSFQAQLSYIAPDGNKYMKVITKRQIVTSSKTKAEQASNAEILQIRVQQIRGTLLSFCKYKESHQYNKEWVNYLKSSKNLKSKTKNQNTINEFLKQNIEFQKAAYALEKQQFQKQLVSEQFFSSCTDNEYIDDEDKSVTIYQNDKSSKSVTTNSSDQSKSIQSQQDVKI